MLQVQEGLQHSQVLAQGLTQPLILSQEPPKEPEFGVKVAPLTKKEFSFHVRSFLLNLCFWGSVIILIAEHNSTFVIALSVVLILLYYIECRISGTAKHLSNEKLPVEAMEHLDRIKATDGHLVFHAKCYHNEVRIRYTQITDSNGNTRTQVSSYIEEVVTHTSQQTVIHSKCLDNTGLVLLNNTEVTRLFINKTFSFVDSNSRSAYESQYSCFKSENKFDVYQHYWEELTIPGFEDRVLIIPPGQKVSRFIEPEWYLFFSLIGFSYLYRLWLQKKTNGKVLTIEKIFSVKEQPEVSFSKADFLQPEVSFSKANFLRAGIVATHLEKLGFSHPKTSLIVKELTRTSPTSSTAFYDSLIMGTKLILELNAFLMKIDMEDTWNFVHIILTDGEDTSSKASFETALGLMLAVGLTMHINTIKTYFIGIDIEQNQKATRDITDLTLAGGENAQFFQISDVEIEVIFDKIRIGLGEIQQTKMEIIENQNTALINLETKNIPVLTIKKPKYVVLFNLDASGSMSGRWRQVCDNVDKFTSHLGDGDLVGGIIFNDQVKLMVAPEEQSRDKPMYTEQPSYRPPDTQDNPGQQNMLSASEDTKPSAKVLAGTEQLVYSSLDTENDPDQRYKATTSEDSRSLKILACLHIILSLPWAIAYFIIHGNLTSMDCSGIPVTFGHVAKWAYLVSTIIIAVMLPCEICIAKMKKKEDDSPYITICIQLMSFLLSIAIWIYACIALSHRDTCTGSTAEPFVSLLWATVLFPVSLLGLICCLKRC